MTVDQIKFWAEFYERGVPDDSSDKHNAVLVRALADVVEAADHDLLGVFQIKKLRQALARVAALEDQK